ncbi:pantetheine-phosphate adenylyltransferase [Pantoea sp. Mhis]|uniref:pantetheine-phosphate adenylyltransferase n=1 Tax=Pantoea sp. Mhis TaxID=2576759 RepID=UPI00135A4A5E|nr:pantetheine-phosphate adenylyltransferase [Pantoea sp. Mhis]MXP56654.1 pantetheine-phosphate adenylyltransferase [Pantoea sp. Mhis]
MSNKAIYPGTFDPITFGHLDIITRASGIFDLIIIAIAANPAKQPLFNIEERIKLAYQVTAELPNVKVIGFNGLITNFAKTQSTNILIHGLRTTSDFEYELRLVQINHHLMPTIENVFLMSTEKFSFISSSIVKELAHYSNDVQAFLPDVVHQLLIKKML